MLVANGNKMEAQSDVSEGAIYATYEALQQLGFIFFHPLQPLGPKVLKLVPPGLKIVETPHWSFRAFHVHTQHPLELTEVLQGFAAPPVTDYTSSQPVRKAKLTGEQITRRLYGGDVSKEEETNKSSQGTEGTQGETWESMLHHVEDFFEWCLAQRLNAVEWMLLGDHGWGIANQAPWRAERLTALVHLAHDFGLRVGVDVPLGLQQQHAWYIVDPADSPETQKAMIRSRLNWVLGCGFDFISTEAGLSEFTNHGDESTLVLLDYFADYANSTWGVPSFIKVHCSTGQFCTNYKDPRNDAPLNYNFLPTHATGNLGVMPHTVQAYGFDDKTAGVYGNEDFSDIFNYLVYEAQQKKRQVLYYGETSYWVNVDVDVPLFLPVYPYRRVADLRKIAGVEKEKGIKIQGMMNFDSGWEWGYWLNDFVTARAAWDPKLDKSSDILAMLAILQPVCRAFGPEISEDLCQWLADLSIVQLDLLLHGQIGNTSSPDITVLSGIAYLSGWDTWCDVPRKLGLHMTQPDKVLQHDYLHPMRVHVLPLLEAMNHTLTLFWDRIKSIKLRYKEGRHNPHLGSFLDEFVEGAGLLALRSRHVLQLYQAADSGLNLKQREQLLKQSRWIIEQASLIVKSREEKYRVPLSRVASWRFGPTVYRFGYLWAVHSLYYWWRDQGVAEQGAFEALLSPCYLNRMDPTEVAFGWGKYALQAIRVALGVASAIHADSLSNCFAPPLEEYKFPRDLHRY